MPKYDGALYDPPAPVAEVALRPINSTAMVVNVHLLLDTGADITFLPRNAVERLGMKPLSGMDYELLSFDGSKSRAQAVEMDMIFLGKIYRGRYLLIDDDRGILGRDILASVLLLLDGPHQEWFEHPIEQSR